MNLLQLPLGVSWDCAFERRNGARITPGFDVAYVFNLGDRHADLPARRGAVILPTSSSRDLGDGTARLGAGVEASLSTTVALNLRYSWESRHASENWSFEARRLF